jgi:hypothetical protein
MKNFKLFIAIILLSMVFPSISSATTLSITSGWNLVGNSNNVPITASSIFNSQTDVSTIWKWETTGTNASITYPAWAFYSPALSTSDLATYAASKGYDVLTTINAGEGFWVNAKTNFTASLPAGSSYSLKTSNLTTGWNLVATGDNVTPASFSTNVGNVNTLWSWDASNNAWYFYAPALASNNNMASYIASKGYKDFGNLTMDNGLGFWVNYAGTGDTVSIPDPVFADALTRLGYPVVNGKMQKSVALSITKLCITSMAGYYGTPDANNTAVFNNTSVPDYGVRCAYTSGAYITDTTGFESFTNLQMFRFEGENFTSINLAPLSKLSFMSLWREPLTSIDLTHNPLLTVVGLTETSLTTVDLSAQVNMIEADLNQSGQALPYTTGNVTVTGFNNIDFSHNVNLRRIYIGGNNMTSLDLSAAKNSLNECWCGGIPVTSLDFSGFTQLSDIMLFHDTQLTTVKMGTLLPRNFNAYYDTALTQVLVPYSVLNWWNAEYASMIPAIAASMQNNCSGTPNPCYNQVIMDQTNPVNPIVGY